MVPVPQSLADCVAGALSLSALGDALGLPNEARGLKGEVSPWPGDDGNAWPLPVADTFREPASNPWNIWAPPEVTAGMRGVVSDDTAVKVVLIEPWLTDAGSHGEAIDEDGFIAWLKRRPAESVAWREAMAAEQARQWLAMFDAAATGTTPCGNDGSPCFYRPGVPVCFGYFLYLELALCNVIAGTQTVRRMYQTCCRLDQGHGRFVTGVLAAALTDASVGVHDRAPVVQAWPVLLDDTHDPVAANSELLSHLRWCLHDLGGQSRNLDPPAFLQRVKTEVYDQPGRGAADALKPFDPVLQLSQLLAYVGYAGDDGLLSLRLAAHGPGDTDTLAAVLGLIAGARLGHTALLRSEAGDALRCVNQTTEALFSRTPGARVHALLTAPEPMGPA